MAEGSVLLLGGSGSLGARTAAALRRSHPDLPLTIVGRDAAKAEALAAELGRAGTAVIDLDRADLGLPENARFSAVVVCLRDHSLNTMTYAQDQGLPYVALSDAAFEIGPMVARYIHRPASAPILLLGHSIGATPMLSAIAFAREFRTIESIEIGLVFDPDDAAGPMTIADMERIMAIAASPLMLKDGRWIWAGAASASRKFAGADGIIRRGDAAALVDTLSLATATDAATIRVDIAEGPTASSLRGLGPSHEVIVEIAGTRVDGRAGRFRYEMVDGSGYAAMSAQGVAACIEALLGLAGGRPARAGLYMPEQLVEPEDMVRRLVASGVRISRPAA